MKLKSARIKNFRCLGDVTIYFSSLTILLGANSAGKSSALRALEFFFEGVELGNDDVFQSLDDAVVSVECIFTDLSEADRESFGPYALGDQMVLRRSWKPGEDQLLTGRGRKFAPFEAIRARTGRDRTRAYRAFRNENSNLGLPDATRVADVDQAMLDWEHGNPEKCEERDDLDASSLFGFSAVGKSKLSERFAFVFVPATGDAAEEAKEKKGSLLTKLLTAVADQRAAADAQLKEIEDEAKARYVEAIGKSHGPVLKELSNALTGQLRRYIPMADVELGPAPAGFSIDPPRVSVRGGEEKSLTDIGRQGHGFQRAFLISVLEYLAEVSGLGTASDNAPTLFLAIEEPELYQHPPRARHLYETLERVASDPHSQVCYATHSVYFVSADRFDSLRVFRRARRDGALYDATVSSGRISVVDQLLPHSYKRDARAYLKLILNDGFREAFFSQAVLLVEGHTDKALLNEVTALRGERSLAADGISIVAVKKTNIPIALAILKAVRTPVYCVFDGDAGGANQAAAASANRGILKALGCKEEDFPKTSVNETWACFESVIEDEVPGLRETAAAVAKELNWNGKSPEAYVEAMRRLGDAAIPDSIVDLIGKARGLTASE